jgi:hypothetical protein
LSDCAEFLGTDFVFLLLEGAKLPVFWADFPLQANFGRTTPCEVVSIKILLAALSRFMQMLLKVLLRIALGRIRWQEM